MQPYKERELPSKTALRLQVDSMNITCSCHGHDMTKHNKQCVVRALDCYRLIQAPVYKHCRDLINRNRYNKCTHTILLTL